MVAHRSPPDNATDVNGCAADTFPSSTQFRNDQARTPEGVKQITPLAGATVTDALNADAPGAPTPQSKRFQRSDDHENRTTKLISRDGSARAEVRHDGTPETHRSAGRNSKLGTNVPLGGIAPRHSRLDSLPAAAAGKPAGQAARPRQPAKSIAAGDLRELPPATPPRIHRRSRHGFDSADLAVLLGLSALALAVVLLSAATH